MKDIRLVATDMDHTLLTEKGELPPMFTDCVEKLSRLGVYVAIASGRPMYTLKSLFPQLQDRLILISDNGAAISLRDEVLFKSLIAPEKYHILARYVEEKTDGIAVICGLDAAYVSKVALPHIDFLRKFYTQLEVVDDLTTVTASANKFTIFYPNADAQISHDQYFVPDFGKHYSITLGDTMWIDMMNVGVNKGSAMRFLDESLGIPTDQMMAFGDTYNDIEMLEAVKFSYTMENAAPNMREHAAFVTASNDDYGVIQVINQLIAAKS